MTSPRIGSGLASWPALFALAVLGPAPAPVVIGANDNVAPAGRLTRDTLALTLEARIGHWYPDGKRRTRALVAAAFAEAGRPPTIPGPLVRVRSGTTIRVRVVNRLDTLPLVLHGMHSHPAGDDDPLQVAPGATRDVTFSAGAPGTYFYWASTAGEALDDRFGIDSQLSGALVVDPPQGPVPADRIFVLSLFDLSAPDATPETPPAPFAPAINGRSWPYTERMNLAVGDTVHWRWINTSADNHPMHLHGFYYRVDSRGTSTADTLYAPAQQREVVTERLGGGTTMTMTWSPERAGQWLMHCHLHFHVAPDTTWGSDYPHIRGPSAQGSGDHAEHPMDDMAGLVLGINVSARAGAAPVAPATARQLHLTVEPAPAPGRIQVALEESGRTVAPPSTPGAPLVLTRGEPAAITVVNRLSQPTAIHWHGIELDSYYDGVPGWSGTATRRSPMIAPGDSFVAHMTPPRAGTFIYHAHNLATKQVGDGLIGPLIVLEPGEVRNPDREIIWIIGGNAIFFTGHLDLNGSPNPPPLVLQANHTYRVRLINITEDNTGDVTLGDGTTPVTWRPLAKDAMPVAASLRGAVPAQVRTSVGETYDFEVDAGTPRTLTLMVRNSGKPMASQVVEIR